MKFKFEPKLDFQINAINSVVDLFKGQVKVSSENIFQVIPNFLTISKEKLLENLKEIQKRNGLPVS